MAEGRDHGFLGVEHSPHLSIGVQLPPLNLEDRLNMEDGGHGGPSGGNPAAFPQVLQGAHRHVDAGGVPLPLQDGFDLLGGLPLVQQGHGVADGPGQGEGDPMVIHHQNPAVVVLGQGLGGFAGTAEAGGHGKMQHPVIGLQQPVP